MQRKPTKPVVAGGPLLRRTKSVALLVETSNTHGRNMLEGIFDYARSSAGWHFDFVEQARGDGPPNWFKAWDGDGVIARIENRVIAEAIAAKGKPIVDLSAARLLPSAPTVETHDYGIAMLVVDHFIERGLRNFAFFGDDAYVWSQQRARHFEDILRGRGHACSVFAARSPEADLAEREAIVRWLQALPKPIGIMTCYDVRALQLLEVCGWAGIGVPDEVAIAGVDNEPLLVHLMTPSLTSVALDSRRMGHLAASLLDRMISGSKLRGDLHLVAPLGLICRQSTDQDVIDDPLVASALKFIRLHACDSIKVDDVLNAVHVSRRILESRFTAAIGITPHKLITQTRMSRVKELLRATGLPLHVIAERAGFEHPEYLSVAFKRTCGMWPSAFRLESAKPIIIAEGTRDGDLYDRGTPDSKG